MKKKTLTIGKIVEFEKLIKTGNRLCAIFWYGNCDSLLAEWISDSMLNSKASVMCCSNSVLYELVIKCGN
jgi:hypothetical protein